MKTIIKTLLIIFFFIKIVFASVSCSVYYNNNFSFNLGNYDSKSTIQTTGTWSISNCTPTTNSMFLGFWSGGTNVIQLKNGSNILNGTVYFMDGVTPASSNNGVLGTVVNVGTITQTVTAIIKIAANQNVPTGTYTHTNSSVFDWYETGTNLGIKSPTTTITATVINPCTVSSTGINFGTVSGTQTLVNGSISTTCGSSVSYTISSDGGNSANISARTMKNGSNSLNYQLYTDSGYTTVWGDGTTGSKVSLTGTGSAQTTTIYGAIPSGQRPTPGTYTDTVNITVTY